IYTIPCLSEAAPMSKQPEDMAVLLYPYQRRAVQRMLEIERGLELTADNLVMRPRGGILCEKVGKGKTAEILGLCLLSPATEDFRADCVAHALLCRDIWTCNMVITPNHLSKQWLAEIKKFCPGKSVVMLDDVNGVMDLQRLREQIARSDFFVVSLETFFQLSTLYTWAKFRCNRVLLDECHDAVALGTMQTKMLAAVECNNMWCVTGTPFPLADDSVYGINQLLKIKVRFVMSANPFTTAKTTLPHEHPFEVLKRHVCVRNKDTSTSMVESAGSQAAIASERSVIRVIPVYFSPVEWAFYKEESRNITSSNFYAKSYDMLRQLCCHPACSTKWMNRLASEYYNDVRGAGGNGYKTLSLDDLRNRMVKWKNEDVENLKAEAKSFGEKVDIALNTISLLAHKRPEFEISRKALKNTLVYDRKRTFRILSPESNSHYVMESSTSVASRSMVKLSVGDVSKLLAGTIAFLKASQASMDEINTTVSELQKQAEYFDRMIEVTTTTVHNEDNRSVVKTVRKSNCYICTEDVYLLGVTPCGHCTCYDCMVSWVARNKHCPSCRKDMCTGDIVHVDLRVDKNPDGALGPEENKLEITVDVKQYGSKPASVLSYCKEELKKNDTTKILLFSSYSESLMVMADALRSEGIENIACGLTEEKVADSVYRFIESTTIRVLLMNSKNAAAGTNLQVANKVVFLEPSGCNPTDALAIETQAIGRTCRLGQTRQVEICYFVVQDTVESKLYDLLKGAREAA
ncbi:unnamed protein product, partial [Ectocarpus fasciculatus]